MKNNNEWTRCPGCNVVESHPAWKLNVLISDDGETMEAVSSSVSFLRGSKPGNGICICPTGSGKSLIIANVIHRLDGPALVFQPSKEILEQNVAKMESYGYRPGIYSASIGRRQVRDITFATIGSVKNAQDHRREKKEMANE